MKIIHLGKFYPPEYGGIETVTFDLVEGLNNQGVKTDVLCSNKGTETKVDLINSGYQVIRAGTLAVINSTSISLKLISELNKCIHQYDAIHIHLPNPMANLAIWLIRPDCKVYLHWHSDIVKQKHMLKLYAPWLRWLIKRADGIVATSQQYADSSKWLSPNMEKVSIIPIGVADRIKNISSALVHKIRSEHKNKKIVLSIGRSAAYKGISYLIEACKYTNDDIVVLIGGPGVETFSDLIKKLGLEYKIKILGTIADQQLASYYAACDIFCLPSVYRSEAYGIVQVEAMSFSKPVVSCDISGSGVSWVNEHEKSGLLVPPSDPVALANAINKLCGDDVLRNKMALYARHRFEQELTAEKMVKKTIRMYTEKMPVFEKNKPAIFGAERIEALFNNEPALSARQIQQKESAN
ncbi:glycosyltransferase [Iodobacter sp. LRB]|uniref:glycosyltransferase n=1 Tax=unclassified Iodobacter TaxID=235634 RepID=UPI000C1181A5|nr:glycosyltransferase [Iodobacter sp. BJB302]PHV03490.1 glycosyl transferase family 1 [Iodobacter sp. BJB302]